MLTCPKCNRRHILSEDEVVLFYPRFFCLSCGTLLPFQVEETRYLELRQRNDRNRKLPNVAAAQDSETSHYVQQTKKTQGMDGG